MISAFRSGYALAILLVLLSCACRPHLDEQRDQQLVLAQGPVLLAGDSRLGLWRWTYARGRSHGQIWQVIAQADSNKFSVESAGKKARFLPLIFDDFHMPAIDSAAINGGFYDAKGALGLVISHGHTVHRFRSNGGSGVFVLTEEGMPEIVHRDSYAQTAAVEHALQSIDRLVDAGHNLVVASNQHSTLAARSAVGLDANGRLSMLLAFDDQAVVQESDGLVYLGRDVVGQGLSLFEFGDLIARPRHKGGLGLLTALNLDGGPSSALEARFASRRYAVVGYHGTINAIAARRLQESQSVPGSP